MVEQLGVRRRLDEHPLVDEVDPVGRANAISWVTTIIVDPS
jgi:hypothetical protein